MVDKRGKKYKYPLPESVYQALAEKLYSPLKLGENSVLLCPPLYGRDHNVNYMWERQQDRDKVLANHHDRFSFALVQLANVREDAELIWLEQLERALGILPQKINNFEQFGVNLKRLISDGQEPTFFINIPETLVDEQFVRFLELAQKIYYIAPARIHFLLIFDMRWNEEDFFKLVSPFRSLFQNTYELSLYTDSETKHLLQHFSFRWNYSLSDKALDYIVQQAGGILLLAKAAFRIAVKEKLNKLSQIQSVVKKHPDYLIQVKFFFYRLTERQRDILKELANFEKVKDSVELEHLRKMGIIIKDASEYRIRSFSLIDYLQEEFTSIAKKLKIMQKSKVFSEREIKVLRELLEKPAAILSRDEIAAILWGERKYDKYSDWAIDQTVSRIRKKLRLISSLSNLRIQTSKKVGFSMQHL